MVKKKKVKCESIRENGVRKRRKVEWEKWRQKIERDCGKQNWVKTVEKQTKKVEREIGHR